MSCNCTFAPDTVLPGPDPSRHVNFEVGMVLGVDDYRQEFAYHSGRDRWIVRELGGYGTTSGLAVGIEDAGGDGPRIRVTAGTAASPGGHLICVGADQCALLNAWLNRPEIAAQVTQIGAELSPPNEAVLKLWLTLCYDSCAVAPVPIPGQPCRSEEDLMSPSRVVDDYRLSLGFDAPPLGEADYLRLMAAYADSLVDGAASPSAPAALKTLAGTVRTQARILFSPSAVDAEAADVAAISFHPDDKPYLMAELRNLWITELRPKVVTAHCSPGGALGEDCLTLAVLTLSVVSDGTKWEVKDAGPGAFEIDLDQAGRPILMSLAMARSAFGIAPDPDEGATPPLTEIITATGNISANAGIALIRAADATLALTATIVGGGAGHPQRRLFLRNAGSAEAKIVANNSGLIDGEAERKLAPGEQLLLAYDGAGSWRTAGGRK